MKLTRLTVEEQALLLAFVETARAECGDRTWTDLEPSLAACWEKSQRGSSELQWTDIAHYVRTACGRDE